MKPTTTPPARPTLRERLTPGFAAVVAALVLAACGGGDGGGSDPPPPAPNTAPTATFTSAAAVAVGEPVVFDAGGSADADGDALVYSWNFGNGLRGGGERIAHIYDEPGTYIVELTVDDGRGGQAAVEGTVTVSPGATATGSVDTLAVVRTATGTPLAGVTVSVVGSGASAATGSDGRASVATARSVPVTLKFSRDGYADQFRRFTLPTAAESGYVEVTMLPREAPLTLADAAAGGTLAGKDGVRITLPAGSLIDADGNPVVGPVQVAMTPVDVTGEGRLFPGRYEGVGTDGTQGLIFSYGTVEFVLTQDGAPVQLAPGRTATIEIPAYATLDRDGREAQVGDTYPLWSLNERTGTWVVEGTGTVVAAATPSGLALRGEVTHFSWWNHDVFDSARPYNPKPRCLVDTNYDGVAENLTGTGYCSHEASPFWEDQQPFRSVDRERAAAGGGERAANTTQARRFPAWVASTSTPVAGGVELPVPAGVNVVFQSYALNGTLYARTVVSGASDVSEDVDIVLQPVQDASGTVPISVPWNQVYAMSHVGEVDRFTVTATAGQNFAITAGRSNFSVLNGSVVVKGPGGAVVGSSTLGSGNASVTITNATAGTYTIEVTATSSAPGAYRLQALPVTASSSCASVTALSLPSPQTSYSIAGNSTRCFTLDLAADQVIDIDLPSRGSLSGALQLRGPNDEVIARDTFQIGSRLPVLRLGVAQAGTYQLEIVNNSAGSGTVQLQGSFITDAQVVSLPQEVTATDIALGETRSYLLKQPVAGAQFGTALTVCDGTYVMIVYPSRTITQVSRTTACGTSRGVGAQAHELHPLVLPVISVTRNANSTDSTGPAEFTLATLAPISLPLDTDVAVTPPAFNRALVYVFDGSAGQAVGLGYDRTAAGSGTLTRSLTGPDGATLSATSGVTTLPVAGLYTVSIVNENSTVSGDFRIRLNNVPAPQPWPLTSPLSERTETLPLGQVLRYTFNLSQAEVYTLRLASPDTLNVSASLGNTTQGSATVSLSGSSSPQQGSTGPSYARVDGTRTLLIRSTSTTQGRSSGTFTVGLQKPVPTATALGAQVGGTLTPFLMQAYAYTLPADGYYLLRWRSDPFSASPQPQFTVWAASTTFANYTGEFGAILSSPPSEIVGSAFVGERPGLLKAGANTVTAYHAATSGNIDYTLSLVRLDAPVDLTVGAAATGGSIGVAGERDYYRFTGVAGQAYTLNVTAQFGGDVYVRRLPGSGNHTDRAATTLATFPRALTAGVPLSAAFTIPADQGGTYIVEVDGAQDATGSYTVQVTSP